MHAVCEGFDDFFSRWYPDIRRLCFAMTENDKDARNLAFKTFLRLGAAKDPQIKENDAKFLLFSSGFTLCVDYFGRKSRKSPENPPRILPVLPHRRPIRRGKPFLPFYSTKATPMP